MQWLLLLSVLVIATCGIIYELVAGTLASYLLGDSVTQFSTVIGSYLFSMGIGSYASKFIKKNELQTFITIEILIGVIGGCSGIILFYLFNYVESFRIVLYSLVGIVGFLVGAEIPLVMRLLKNQIDFNELIARVFSFDYIGALLASIVFPLLLVPHLGLGKTPLLFGLINIVVAGVVLIQLQKRNFPVVLFSILVFCFILLTVLFAFTDKIVQNSDEAHFGERIIISKNTHYQRIVVTQSEKKTRLYLNGNLQFSSDDEYRYHEALVHPGMMHCTELNRALILGGGDGCAARELLKYPQLKSVQLVDLDNAMTFLFSNNSFLKKINHNSLIHPNVKINNTDAFLWIKNCKDSFDFICIDFPDPSNFSVGKLYSQVFYSQLKPILKHNGIAVIQCTSPWVAPKSFWCIEKTLRSAGFNTLPYHAHVPSFGDWGFILISKLKNVQQKRNLPKLKFINAEMLQHLFYFPPDQKPKENLEINQLQNQILVQYFDEEWNKN